MNDYDQATAQPPYDANRASEERTPSGTGDPGWSGVSSGSEGVMPLGAAFAGSTSDSSSQSGQQDQSGGGMDSVIGAVSQKAGAISEGATSSLDSGMERASQGMDTLAGAIRDRSHSLGGAESVATMAADKLESGAELIRGQNADQLVSELESLVRRKPVESMLVAAGVGFILSKAMR